jgi:hypothetical protein
MHTVAHRASAYVVVGKIVFVLFPGEGDRPEAKIFVDLSAALAWCRDFGLRVITVH